MTDNSEQRKPGRRTRDEEIDLYLANLGLDRSDLEMTRDAPQTVVELRDRLIHKLWGDFDNLNATAKVGLLQALRQLAKEDPDAGGDEEPDPTVAEVITGIPQLSDERKRTILTGALGRLDEERDRILEVLNA